MFEFLILPVFFDIELAATLTEKAFHLPFPPGVTYRVSAGPGDAPHHLNPRNRFAYDFALPLGGEVSVAAPGVVIHADARHGDLRGDSAADNFIAVRHDNGLVSEYHHLMEDGVLVRRGEEVERGEVIGLSGASGKAEGPHLHFVVLREEESVPVTFAELRCSPVTGNEVTSKNVPPRSARGPYLEKGIDVLHLLLSAGKVNEARLVHTAIERDLEPGSNLSARRKAMALRAYWVEVEKEIEAACRSQLEAPSNSNAAFGLPANVCGGGGA